MQYLQLGLLIRSRLRLNWSSRCLICSSRLLTSSARRFASSSISFSSSSRLLCSRLLRSSSFFLISSSLRLISRRFSSSKCFIFLCRSLSFSRDLSYSLSRSFSFLSRSDFEWVKSLLELLSLFALLISWLEPWLRLRGLLKLINTNIFKLITYK